VIDGAILTVDGTRLSVSLMSRSPTLREQREHDEAQQALAVLGAERGQS
jgi:hypothetical protein